MSIRLRYPEVAPGGYAALSAFGHYLTTETTLEPVLKALVDLRASQLNGCEFCISLHSAELRKHHDFAAVSEFFTGKDLADLTYAIANINAWNRLGIAFRPTWNSNHGQPEKQDVLSDDGAKVAED
jgi:AhpD family alkylhydroperoxidase